MAQWVSADLAKLLPDEFQAAISAARALTTTVQAPLEVVQATLKLAKSIILGLPPLDFTSILRGIVEDLRTDFFGTGYYVLDMWDYPTRQMTPPDLRPGSSESLWARGYRGTDFKRTFLTDLINSFYDEADENRPVFQSKVSMLILVVSAASLDDLAVNPGEDSMGAIWKGFATRIGSAARSIDIKRWQAAWYRMRLVAEVQSSTYTASRVHRLMQAKRRYDRMSESERDVIPPPPDFLESKDISSIEWDDVVTVIEAIEESSVPTTYPDWSRKSLREIHPDLFTLFDDVFDALLDLLGVGTSIVKAITDMITAIEDKLKELTAILDRIDEVLELLDDLLAATGIKAIFVSSDSGVLELISKLEAADSPFSIDSFYAGMAILVGGPSALAFDALFAPIGSVIA